MEKFAIASNATKDVVKFMKDDLCEALSILVEARDNINKGFEDMKKYQDALAAKNSGLNVDGSDILYINTGGFLMSVT